MNIKEINELVDLLLIQQSATEAYRDAIKVMAKKSEIKSSALRRFIKAKADGETNALKTEIESIEALIKGKTE